MASQIEYHVPQFLSILRFVKQKQINAYSLIALLGLKTGSHSGDDGDEDPPVPIPNTEVKLIYGESSWHRAPARIANCRISIKNDRFSTEKRSFFLYLHFLASARFRVFQTRLRGKNHLVFFSFRVNFDVFFTA